MKLSSDFEIINKIIIILFHKFGLRKNLDQKTIKDLRNIFTECQKNGKFSDFVKEIKLLLNLSMGFRLQYVYNKSLSEHPKSIRDLLIKNFQDDTKWSARVVIPSDLPLFGSPDLENFTLKIEIKKTLKYETFEVFFYCILHEMSHVLLWITGSKLWEHEKAVDLLPMVLGFSGIVKKGRRSPISNHSRGYLSDQELDFAYQEIRRLQGRGHFLGSINKIRKIFQL